MGITTIAGTIYGYAAGESITYTTARNTSTKSSTTTVDFGQARPLGYYVSRAYISFDTSGIAGTIEKVRLGWKGIEDNVVIDFTGIVKKYNWAGLTFGSNREAMYDGALAATSETNNMGLMKRCSSPTTIYYSGDLDTSWISRAGTTYYALVSLEDVNNSAPTKNEYFIITNVYLEVTAQDSMSSPSSNGYSSGPMMFKPPTDLLKVLKKPVFTQIASPRKVCQGIIPRSVCADGC
ncbi:MAG: hypothetical protein WC455_24390 [Dehalococcoidia bacterium]|jgi:hypothetical protein